MDKPFNDFLPVKSDGTQPDFICVTGDAYVDHPSFGVAVVSRLLESRGFSVGIIAQPVTDSDFTEFGEPRYCFMVSGGNIDSMVANYTVSGKKRYNDAYSPDGLNGKPAENGRRVQALRPDYAVNAYCKSIKRLFPDSQIVIGGLEASLRRFAHYDYWTDIGVSRPAEVGIEHGDSAVLPSVLVSSGADLLIYGMAEMALIQLSDKLRSGIPLTSIKDLRGTCVVAEPKSTPVKVAECDSLELVSANKRCYAKACVIQYNEQDEIHGRTVIQRHGNVMLVQNPPARSLTESEMDKIYALPFMRTYHPIYNDVPAIREVEFSITWTRGCFGFCSFCSIALHQGGRVRTRSEESVAEEAEKLTKSPNWKGYIHDVGGPTANFGQPSCKKQAEQGMCRARKCLSPKPCPNLEASHSKYLRILRRLRSIKGVKRVFVRSGIRYDYIKADKSREFLRDLVEFHTSGQLKVAPEHIKPSVLNCMGKPQIADYDWFCEEFAKENRRTGKEQYLIPYLMSSHPGATLNDAIDLMMWLKKRKIRPEQVQDFYPTPGTISTAMYYTGMNPFTLEPLYVAKSAQQKEMQRALLQYYKPENRALVDKALKIAGRATERNNSNAGFIQQAKQGKTGNKHNPQTERTRGRPSGRRKKQKR
jgi:uncharacterized radical SAM protein YgiQ